ncbi:hypothetical protein [Caballeronia sp.]|uniref:hypothetical protein n=1 Tax=Caballeronia sp. TaxID=1931223 RepID=UPI003C47A2B5
MGAPDDSIREELIGAVLGELSLLRRDVTELVGLLERNGQRFANDSDLAILKLASRSDQFLNDFRASSADVLDKANAFGEAREQLLAEIALRQYDEVHVRYRALIREVLGELPSRTSVSRVELALWSIGVAVLSATLSAAAVMFFK